MALTGDDRVMMYHGDLLPGARRGECDADIQVTLGITAVWRYNGRMECDLGLHCVGAIPIQIECTGLKLRGSSCQKQQ